MSMQMRALQNSQTDLRIAVQDMARRQDDLQFQVTRAKELIHESENCTKAVMLDAKFAEMIGVPVSPGSFFIGMRVRNQNLIKVPLLNGKDGEVTGTRLGRIK